MYDSLLKDLEHNAASHHDGQIRNLCDDAHAAICRLVARQSLVRDQIEALRQTCEVIAERTAAEGFGVGRGA